MTLSTRERDTLTCSASECKKIVHILYDKYTRGISKMTNAKYKCPKCNKYDPVTKMKKNLKLLEGEQLWENP